MSFGKLLPVYSHKSYYPGLHFWVALSSSHPFIAMLYFLQSYPFEDEKGAKNKGRVPGLEY